MCSYSKFVNEIIASELAVALAQQLRGCAEAKKA
jgi:hypothetical protein